MEEEQLGESSESIIEAPAPNSHFTSKKVFFYISFLLLIIIGGLIASYLFVWRSSNQEASPALTTNLEPKAESVAKSNMTEEEDIFGSRNLAALKDFYNLPPKSSDNGSQQTRAAYYISFISIDSVKMSDGKGNNARVLGEMSGGNIPGVTIDSMGDGSAMVVVDSESTYTFDIAQNNNSAGLIQIVYGIGNGAGSEMAIQYRDLMLPTGSPAQFQTTSKGVTQLRYSQGGTGQYLNPIAPTSVVYGQQSSDTDGPVVTISGKEQGNSVLITITASDTAGVDKIFYSTNNSRFNIYDKPFLVSNSTPEINSFAQDKIGNRGSVTTYNINTK